MPYTIVKTFEKGNSKLSAVPSNWVKDGILHWPRYNINKLTRMKNSYPENDWRKINCKIKRSDLTSFLQAEQEINKMCNKSETDTDTDQYYLKENQNENMVYDKLVQDCIMYENISSEALNTAPTNVTQPDEATLQHTLLGIQPSASSTGSNARQTTNIGIDDASSVNLMVLEKLASLEENYKMLNENISDHIKAQQEDRKFVNESVQSVLLGLSNITVQFQHVMNRLSRAEEHYKQGKNIQIIKSEHELNNFETLLENPETEEEWKKKFSIICGKGKGRGVNNAYALVNSMFSRCFLLQCSWAGGSRTSEKKVCFKSHTKIINFFFDIIHESDSSFTLLDCHKFFKNILKNSRQRNESKQERISRTKNRPKTKANCKNSCNETQPSLPGTCAPENSSEVFLPAVGASGSGNRSQPVVEMSDDDDYYHTKPLKTSV